MAIGNLKQYNMKLQSEFAQIDFSSVSITNQLFRLRMFLFYIAIRRLYVLLNDHNRLVHFGINLIFIWVF